MSRLASALVALVLVVGGMYAGIRLASPTTRSYNLGSLSYSVEPTLHGHTEIIVPFTGWRLEGRRTSAPFVLRVKPKSVSATGVAEAALGVHSTLHTAEQDIVHGAIWAFVYALLYALVGGLVGAAVAAVLLLFFRGFGAAILGGIGGVVLAVALTGGMGVWIWQSDYIHALKHPTVIAGKHSRELTLVARAIARTHSLQDVIHELAPVLEKSFLP